MSFFPTAVFLLAPVTTVVAFVMLAWSGDLRARQGMAAIVVFLIAAYCQFLGSSAALVAAGLVAQSLLAIVLIVTWRLSA